MTLKISNITGIEVKAIFFGTALSLLLQEEEIMLTTVEEGSRQVVVLI